jgi:hypothetical protein
MATETTTAPATKSTISAATIAKIEEGVSWLGARLREPSTYAGLAVLLGAFGHFTLPHGAMDNIALIGTGIGGLIAIFLPEGKS